MYSFYPRPTKLDLNFPSNKNYQSIVTTVLEEYFQRHVILFSSGRAALGSYLGFRGFHLYQHTIALPTGYVPDCVIDTVSKFAFPVRCPQAADVLLYYHQYGYRQIHNNFGTIAKKYDLVIEDAAHLFFQQEKNNYPRVLSFPKFLPVGFGGALVLTSKKEKEAVIDWLENRPTLPQQQEKDTQKLFFNYFLTKEHSLANQARLYGAYALVHYYPKPFKSTLAQMPTSVVELKKIEKTRMDYFDQLAKAVTQSTARNYLAQTTTTPFFLPVYFTEDKVKAEKLIKQMGTLKVWARVYHIDINRNQFSPRYVSAVVLPCHQLIPKSTIKKMAEIIAKF